MRIHRAVLRVILIRLRRERDALEVRLASIATPNVRSDDAYSDSLLLCTASQMPRTSSSMCRTSAGLIWAGLWMLQSSAAAFVLGICRLPSSSAARALEIVEQVAAMSL